MHCHCGVGCQPFLSIARGTKTSRVRGFADLLVHEFIRSSATALHRPRNQRPMAYLCLRPRPESYRYMYLRKFFTIKLVLFRARLLLRNPSVKTISKYFIVIYSYVLPPLKSY